MSFPPGNPRRIPFTLPFLLLIALSFAVAAGAAGSKSPICKNPIENKLIALLVGVETYSRQTDNREVVSASFDMAMVKIWVDGDEGEFLTGVTATFGAELPKEQGKSPKVAPVFSNPLNGCTNSSSKLAGSAALSIRGDCDFVAKAKVAQLGGAAALLVINNKEVAETMDCSGDGTPNISIPVVMIAKSDGDDLNKTMSNKHVELLLYAPTRPIVDISVVFLWAMSVGTLITASLWQEFGTSEQLDKNESSLKESSNPGAGSDDDTLDITVKGAIIFVILASVFLLLLYFFMSKWFIWVLIVLFCIGAVQVTSFCL
ncbi:hypothetical protein V6N11_031376 [Hibiscus sabdariffa]|uniref:PA domain-containing protein n=1 Tax=Hibiscus sabdariffa TaxID=183260 RepID=A0ABR2SXF9_9ROSI